MGLKLQMETLTSSHSAVAKLADAATVGEVQVDPFQIWSRAKSHRGSRHESTFQTG